MTVLHARHLISRTNGLFLLCPGISVERKLYTVSSLTADLLSLTVNAGRDFSVGVIWNTDGKRSGFAPALTSLSQVKGFPDADLRPFVFFGLV